MGKNLIIGFLGQAIGSFDVPRIIDFWVSLTRLATLRTNLTMIRPAIGFAFMPMKVLYRQFALTPTTYLNRH